MAASPPSPIMVIFISSRWRAAVPVHQDGQTASMAQPVVPVVAAKAMDEAAQHQGTISWAFRNIASVSVAVAVQAPAASTMTIKAVMGATVVAAAVVVSTLAESMDLSLISTRLAEVMAPLEAMVAVGKAPATAVEAVKVDKVLVQVAAAVVAAVNARAIRAVAARALTALAELLSFEYMNRQPHVILTYERVP